MISYWGLLRDSPTYIPCLVQWTNLEFGQSKASSFLSEDAPFEHKVGMRVLLSFFVFSK